LPQKVATNHRLWHIRCPREQQLNFAALCPSCYINSPTVVHTNNRLIALFISVKEYFSMPQSGLGVLLRKLRDSRTLSLREVGQLCAIDHAYVHRLETGEKESPSEELLVRLLRVLKPSERESEMAKWLAAHPNADPSVVEYALNNPAIPAHVFIAAASMAHRGSGRPDTATLFARVQRAFEDE
jgi:transcriptional regulator with XRE-family HTH domain